MPTPVKQALETLFTSYLLPALLVPLVWVVRFLVRRFSRATPTNSAEALVRLETSHAWAAGLLIAGGLLTYTVLPIERGGRALTLAVWLLYAGLNWLFADLATRLAGSYGALPDGREKDRIFLRFLAATIFQPLATAGAFVLLYRLLRVVYHRTFPWIDVPTQGI